MRRRGQQGPLTNTDRGRQGPPNERKQDDKDHEDHKQPSIVLVIALISICQQPHLDITACHVVNNLSLVVTAVGGKASRRTTSGRGFRARRGDEDMDWYLNTPFKAVVTSLGAYGNEFRMSHSSQGS